MLWLIDIILVKFLILTVVASFETEPYRDPFLHPYRATVHLTFFFGDKPFGTLFRDFGMCELGSRCVPAAVTCVCVGISVGPRELGAWGGGQSWSRTLALGAGPVQELPGTAEAGRARREGTEDRGGQPVCPVLGSEKVDVGMQ